MAKANRRMLSRAPRSCSPRAAVSVSFRKALLIVFAAFISFSAFGTCMPGAAAASHAGLIPGFNLLSGVLLSVTVTSCPYGVNYGNSDDYCVWPWDMPGICPWPCSATTSTGAYGHCNAWPVVGTLYKCIPPPLAGSLASSPQTVSAGQSVTLTASWTGGKPPYTVHWYASASASCTAEFWSDTNVPSSTSAPSAPTGTKTRTVTPSASTWYCVKVTDSSYNKGDSAAPAYQDLPLVVTPIKVTVTLPPTTTSTSTSTSSSTTSTSTSTSTTSASTTSSTSMTSTSLSSTSSTSSSTTTTSMIIVVPPPPPSPSQACGFATVNRGGWIGINVLVVLLTITISAFVYAIGNLLPAERREKLRGVVNYEILEAFLSLIIIIVLIGLASLTCNAGASLVGYSGYTDLFNSVDTYLGNMLFVNGLNFLGSLYSTSIQYTVIANIAYFTLNRGLDFLQSLPVVSSMSSIGGDALKISFSSNIDALFSAYSGIFTGTYGTLLSLSFGGLFILFIFLPMIKAGALTVVAPLAIIFRSIGFAGPQLRKTANAFLAMAIGFYFVLPLTIAFDVYVASCLNIGLGIRPVACSYPFSSYLSGYDVTTLTVSMFTSQASYPMGTQAPSFASGISLPTSFYATAIGSNLGQFFQSFFDAPSVAAEYGQKIAAYIFMSIVLVALDIAITAGFIAGLAKGLDAMGGLFGAGGFWRE